jgi:hypothetical protein
LGFAIAPAAAALLVGGGVGLALGDLAQGMRGAGILALYGYPIAILFGLPTLLLLQLHVSPRFWIIVPVSAAVGAAPWLVFLKKPLIDSLTVATGFCGALGGVVFWLVVGVDWNKPSRSRRSRQARTLSWRSMLVVSGLLFLAALIATANSRQ